MLLQKLKRLNYLKGMVQQVYAFFTGGTYSVDLTLSIDVMHVALN